jgi:hypothetical protein
MALGVSITAAIATCALSANRTIRRVAEAPDLAPMVHSVRWLPRVGSALATAVTHFSARTIFRSGPHRVIYTFYVGLGFALSALFLKTPRAGAVAADAGTTVWTDTAAPLIVSSVVMTVCALVGARLTFAMPRDLGANWIFRMVPIKGGAPFVIARRRAFLTVAAGPTWLLAAVVFLTQWPLRPALGHLLVLGLLSATIVELCLGGTQRIPFTCSYLPGQSRSHIVVPLAVIMLLILSIVGADAELLALQDGRRYALMSGLLALAWAVARRRTFWASRGTAPEFDDEPGGRVVALDVWDARRP